MFLKYERSINFWGFFLGCCTVFSISPYLSLLFLFFVGWYLWRDFYDYKAVFFGVTLLFGLLVFFALHTQAATLTFKCLLGVISFLIGAYFGLHALLVLFVAQFLRRFSLFWRVFFSAGLVSCVGFWLAKICLWPLGVCEGVYLLHPLRPLVSFWFVRVLLSWFGLWGSIFVLFYLFFFILSFLSAPFGLLFFLFIFFLMQVFEGPSDSPLWLSHLCFVSSHFHPFARCGVYQELERFELELGSFQGRSNSLFLLPETALPVVANTPTVEYFVESLVSDNSALLCGTYHKKCGIESDPGSFANSAMYVLAGNKATYYDKSHRVVFAERFPFVALWILERLGYKAVSFIQGESFIKRFKAPFGDFNCVPIMCSEIFFTNRLSGLADNAIDQDFFVALVNDGWFGQKSFFTKQLFETACLQVVCARSPLVYVSYSYHGYFDSMGRWISL